VFTSDTMSIIVDHEY